MAGAATGLNPNGRALALALAFLSVLFLTNAPVQAAVMAFGPDGALCAVHDDKGGSGKQVPTDRQAACAACAVCHLGAVLVSPGGPALATSAASTPVLRSLRPASLNPRGPPTLAAWPTGPPILS